MGLGTKNRQKQTAELCKQHMRQKYPDKLGLVEDFIVEIEGPPQNCDLTRWGRFTDVKGIKKEMFQRLEIQFENWLNPLNRRVLIPRSSHSSFAHAVRSARCGSLSACGLFS